MAPRSFSISSRGFRSRALCKDTANDCEKRIAAAGPGGTSPARAVEHRTHQPAADRLVLRRRIDRYRPDAGDRAAFVEKVAADDISVLLGHHRVEAWV